MKNCVSEDSTIGRLAFCLSGLKKNHFLILAMFKNVGVILDERRLFKGT